MIEKITYNAPIPGDKIEKTDQGTGFEHLISNEALKQAEAMRREIEKKARENYNPDKITDAKIDSIVDEAYWELVDMYKQCLSADCEASELPRSNKVVFVYLGLKVAPEQARLAEIKKSIAES